MVGVLLVSCLATAQGALGAGKQAAFVIDANTGAVISASNADEPRYPASLTKMMTLFIVFDLIEQGRLNYQTLVSISENAAAAQPSKLGLEVGSQIALIDAVKVIITRSANDIAVAVAEHIAGSEEKFAALMTQKARTIGMKSTTFKNASGLPNRDQVTTARDMVTLGLRLHDDFPKHYALFAMREFHYGGKAHPNHNTMLNSFEGTEGIKTGYTSASGFNLVASVKRGNRHVMGAVFGGASAASRNQTMRTLLNLALFKSSAIKTRVPTSTAARGRPAPEPRPEGRQARPQVVATAEPVTPRVARAEATKPAEPPASPAATQSNIEIARVRPVLVAPRQPRQAPQVEAGPWAAVVGTSASGLGGTDPWTAERKTAAMPAMTHPSTSDAQAKPVVAPANFQLPPIVAGSAPLNSVPTQRPSAPKHAETTVSAKTAAQVTPADTQVPTVTPGRGNPPSSLQRQAANLGNGAATPASARPNLAAGAVEIQIGAYSSAAEAERQLIATRSKAGDLLGNAPGVTHETTANGKALWRARFSGFQASTAGSICSELRRRQIDCMLAKAE